MQHLRAARGSSNLKPKAVLRAGAAVGSTAVTCSVWVSVQQGPILTCAGQKTKRQKELG